MPPRRAIKYALIDAFTDEAFKGNPAALCLLEANAEADLQWMKSVAGVFNAPMTAFLSQIISDTHDDAKGNDGGLPQFRILLLTTRKEVDLCAHATLAATHFLSTSDLVKHDIVSFVARIGVVTAKKVLKADFTAKGTEDNPFVELNFPVVPLVEGLPIEPSLPETLNGVSVVNIQRTSANDLLVELSSGQEVAMLQPDLEEIKRSGIRKLIVAATAPDKSDYDLFTRVFCPRIEIKEASPRTGVLYVELEEESQRVLIRGEAVTVMLGTLLV